MAGTCEQGNKNPAYKKRDEFIDHLTSYKDMLHEIAMISEDSSLSHTNNDKCLTTAWTEMRVSKGRERSYTIYETIPSLLTFRNLASYI